jgi:hypothetical protein
VLRDVDGEFPRVTNVLRPRVHASLHFISQVHKEMIPQLLLNCTAQMGFYLLIANQTCFRYVDLIKFDPVQHT